jgi:hypothetical protein
MQSEAILRYVENGTVVGEGRVPTFDPPDPQQIPKINHEFLLDTPTEEWARVIAVEEESPGADGTRVVTVRFERI